MQQAARSSDRRAVRRAPTGAIALACMLLAGAAAAERPVGFHGQGVQLACVRPTLAQLSCDYRLLEPSDPGIPTARLLGVELALPMVTPLSAGPGTSAALILVDTSAAADFSAVAPARRDLRLLAQQLPDRVSLGLAAFAAELRVLAPLGSTPEAVAAAVDDLATEGSSTELYRNTLEAVRLLGGYDARRRALILLSHGVADDRAYFHADVVRAAHEHGVALFGVGYAASPEEAAALQRLRRLAEETGGLYLAAARDRPLSELDARFAARALALLESGGRLSVDLSTALEQLEQQGIADPVVVLGWGTSASGVSARVPLSSIPVAGAPAGTSRLVNIPPAPGTVSARSQAPPVPPVHRSGFPAAYWPWLVVGLALLAAGGAGVYLYLRRRSPEPPSEPLLAETVKLSARSFAFLETQDEEQTRHPLTGEVFRIGRHADNELPLTDPSMSRHHAEVRHELNGRYVIRDLESLNGVYVNGKKCRSAALSNGDVIELGDVTLKFTVSAAQDPSAAEPVAEGGTVTPFRTTGKRKPRAP